MTDEIPLAFAPLEARAAAMGGPNPPDRLSLRDHVVGVEIGAFQEERGARQRLRFNVVVELAPRDDAGDDVDRILSYDRLTEAIEVALASERLNLVETLAERIAERLLTRPQVARVFIRIEKLDRGPGALGVEIVRAREGFAVPSRDAAAGLTVHIVGSDVPVEALAAISGPAVIVPECGERLAAQGLGGEPALRIALLALEQAAWGLASAIPALSVLASRTEMNWALAQGRVVLWAPSKLVLDTPGAPRTADTGALASWLADQLGAEAIHLHGSVAVPADCRARIVRA